MAQDISFGIGNLQRILRELNSKKVFLVVDSSYPYICIKGDIESLPVDKVFFSGFTPNPVYEQVCEGIDLIRREECDCIVAIGGGSAIDVAKCIKLALLANEGRLSLIPPVKSSELVVEGSSIPLVAIPTTAGTGSESTHNAVMYYQGVKQTITNDAILPDFAVLESSVLSTLPVYQKKCTMMDALCQGIESWWSVNSTEESIGYSREAIRLIMDHWQGYIFDNGAEAARQIMIAANYSGKGINIAQTTAAHAMSYKITSLYDLPHGHAVAVCLPEIWEYMLSNPDQCSDNRGWDYLQGVFTDIAKAMGANTPKEAIGIFRTMMKEMELSSPTSTDREADLEILSNSINPVRLKNNPVRIGATAAHTIYDKVII